MTTDKSLKEIIDRELERYNGVVDVYLVLDSAARYEEDIRRLLESAKGQGFMANIIKFRPSHTYKQQEISQKIECPDKAPDPGRPAIILDDCFYSGDSLGEIRDALTKEMGYTNLEDVFACYLAGHNPPFFSEINEFSYAGVFGKIMDVMRLIRDINSMSRLTLDGHCPKEISTFPHSGFGE